ncbi:MAG: polymer-forming cytoskeletal protein [Clostridiaceae bacterium]
MVIEKLKQCGILRILLMMIMFLFMIVLSGSLTSAKAATIEPTDVLNSGQIVDGPGFFAGEQVRVDGTVNGTTFAFGQEVRIDGIINGDLIVAAQRVTINGKVNGNIYSAGQDLSIGTKSAGDVFFAGERVDIGKETVIGRDLFAAGSAVSLNGNVQREFFGAGSDIAISGSVGRDVNLDVDNFTLKEGAVINGDLSYEGPNEASIANGSKINGKTDWQYKTTDTNKEIVTPGNFTKDLLMTVASALLIWFLVIIWRPHFWSHNARMISERPFKTLGVGLLALIVTPILVIISWITVVGLPLGMILGAVYGIVLYLSKIIVAVFAGLLLAKRFSWAEKYKGILPVLLALIILELLLKVSVLGVIIWFAITFAGLGSFVLANYKPVK